MGTSSDQGNAIIGVFYAQSRRHALTKNLAMEWAEDGIRANAVAPAVVLTTTYKSFIEEDQIEGALQGLNDFHPIGRIGSVGDMANAVEFLLSEKASWMDGYGS